MEEKNKTKAQLIDEVITLRQQVTELENRLVAISRLEQELNLLYNETAIIERVLETTVNLLRLESVGYGLVDEQTGRLEYYYHPIHNGTETIKLCLPLDEKGDISLNVIDRKQVVETLDAIHHINGLSSLPGRYHRTWLSALIKRGERIIGMLNAESSVSNPFTANDQQFLQTLADLTAMAIENTRLYSQTRRRIDELATLSLISQAITSTLDLQETLTTITDHAIRLLDAMAASVTLLDEVEGNLRFEAASGPSSDFVREMDLAIEQGIVGWVIQHGEPALVPDVSQDIRFFDGVDRQSGFTTHSILCVPLQTRERTIGAIEVINKRNGSFNQRDLRLLNWLTMPAITAIENARLFEAEHRAREQAEILCEATSTLTSTLDSDQVLDAILTHLAQVVPYDSAYVFLCQGEGLYMVAGRGLSLVAKQLVGQQYPSDNTLYRQIRSTGHPIILTDALADPRFQCGHGLGYIRGWMGVPLMVQSKVIGYLTLESRQMAAYGQVEADLAQAFANQAAIAIQNARLFEQVRIGHKRLQSLSHRLVEVQETERRHIARELHDEAGQALTSLMVGLCLLERGAACPESVVNRITELKRMTDNVLENLHRLAMDLRPASLDHLGLVAALRQYVETFNHQHSLTVQFEATGFDNKRLPPAVETNLYRIVQEALTNIVRHAQATHIGVLLKRRDDQMVTIVEDNGIGFDPEVAGQSGRLGLLGMRERAEMLGGTLIVESAAGKGTTIFVEVPNVYSHPDR